MSARLSLEGFDVVPHVFRKFVEGVVPGDLGEFGGKSVQTGQHGVKTGIEQIAGQSRYLIKIFDSPFRDRAGELNGGDDRVDLKDNDECDDDWFEVGDKLATEYLHGTPLAQIGMRWDMLASILLYEANDKR
jgi:hypothetical protein